MGRVTLPHTRFTLDEFARLVDADVFGTTRVELLNGRIYRMAPQAEPHMAAVSKSNQALGKVIGANDWLIIQGTIRLDRFSAPDPDLLWVPCPIGTPSHLWPEPVLLIEVSDTTYRKDCGIKLRTYALHGIPEYWIENLRADRVEVYRDPQNPTGRLRDCQYSSIQHFGRGGKIPIAARPGVALSVDDLLP